MAAAASVQQPSSGCRSLCDRSDEKRGSQHHCDPWQRLADSGLMGKVFRMWSRHMKQEQIGRQRAQKAHSLRTRIHQSWLLGTFEAWVSDIGRNVLTPDESASSQVAEIKSPCSVLLLDDHLAPTAEYIHCMPAAEETTIAFGSVNDINSLVDGCTQQWDIWLPDNALPLEMLNAWDGCEFAYEKNCDEVFIQSQCGEVCEVAPWPEPEVDPDVGFDDPFEPPAVEYRRVIDLQALTWDPMVAPVDVDPMLWWGSF